MARAVVAVVGRPNVGKSTLFNRLVGERIAIVEDLPGTTRDRNYATTEWRGREFSLIDTGGLDDPRAGQMEAAVRRQAEAAIEEADVVLFLVDAQTGILPVEHDVADLLRRSRKPVLLVANKADAWRGAGRRVLRARPGRADRRVRDPGPRNGRPPRRDRGAPARAGRRARVGG